jgi:uncharacterized repeat protein (TIGR03803 family)
MNSKNVFRSLWRIAAEQKWATRAFAAFLLCATSVIALSAQTLTTLHSFGGVDGADPLAPLIQGTDGNIYGTTVYGGINQISYGTVFNITPDGGLTTVYSFCSQSGCTDGYQPQGGLVQYTDGNFYGTTSSGGMYGHGSVFKLTSTGTLTTLYSFCSQTGCPDGDTPIAGLVLANNGAFYGTTKFGGSANNGTAFKITPAGVLTKLHNFGVLVGHTDGYFPIAGLVLGTNGNLYGVTEDGGQKGGGTFYRLTPSGVFTTLYSFCSAPQCADGDAPTNALIQGTDGNFYGTTKDGGAINGSFVGSGIVFKISPSGIFTTLHTFCAAIGCTDGGSPTAALFQANDGNFYGSTSHGGTNNTESFCGSIGCGTLFKITRTGKFTTLYNFCGESNCADGGTPEAALMQDTNGIFYGTTHDGGASGQQYSYGTVFSLSMGLAAFVETQPTSGKVGATIKILGTNLTGATSVTFNGTAATFTVVSNSEITTTVPSGATTGLVKVVTPSGTLSSNLKFRIK